MSVHCDNPQGPGVIDAELISRAKVVDNEKAAQKSLTVSATKTKYEFKAGAVDLSLTFTSPLLMNELDVMSRPASYITYSVKSNDGTPHQVQVELQASGSI